MLYEESLCAEGLVRSNNDKQQIPVDVMGGTTMKPLPGVDGRTYSRIVPSRSGWWWVLLFLTILQAIFAVSSLQQQQQQGGGGGQVGNTWQFVFPAATALPIQHRGGGQQHRNKRAFFPTRLTTTTTTNSKVATGGVRDRTFRLLSSTNDNVDDNDNDSNKGKNEGGDASTKRDEISTPGLMNRANFLGMAGSVLLSSSVLAELYSRIGAWFIRNDNVNDNQTNINSNSQGFLVPPPDPNVRHATIVFHGSGGQDVYTDRLMRGLRQNNNNVDNKSYYHHIVDWSGYSTNVFQASYNGQRIGRLVANELKNRAPHLQTLHVIGISVGSFAADELTRSFKAKQHEPFVQLTLLDPFTQRGIFGLGYGNRNFGSAADYTQQYLNTDDPVPSTNAPLDLADVCYDITDLRPSEIFGHDWPVAYYGQSEECGRLYDHTKTTSSSSE